MQDPSRGAADSASLPFQYNISHAYGFPVTPDDIIRCEVFNLVVGTTVAFTAIIRTWNGTTWDLKPMRVDVVPTSDGVISFKESTNPPDGEIISAMAFLTSNTLNQRGDTFVRCSIRRRLGPAVNPTFLLLEDYVTCLGYVSFPGSRMVTGIDGQGSLTTITIADPGAGSDINFTVPDNMVLRIQGIELLLTTSATAGNRITKFQWKDANGNVIRQQEALSALVASQTSLIDFAPDGILGFNSSGYFSGNLNPTRQVFSLPQKFLVRSGDRFTSIVSGLLAGDVFSAIFMRCERWVFPNSNSIV